MPNLRDIRQRLLRDSDYARKWSRTAVAARLEVADVTLGRWERGHQRPHPRHIAAIAREYGVSVEEVEQSLPAERGA